MPLKLKVDIRPAVLAAVPGQAARGGAAWFVEQLRGPAQ